MSFEIHNYYESLVTDYVRRTITNLFPGKASDQELMDDIACIALNQLPARYVRHQVDTSFYLTAVDREEMEGKIRDAVDQAIDHIIRHSERRPSTFSQ